MSRYPGLLLLSAALAAALPRSSLGWLLQRDIASVFVVTGNPDFGCTPEEVASLDQGVTDTITLVNAAIAGLASPDVVTSPAFVDWLGATNGPRRAAISAVFGGIASNLLNPGQGTSIPNTRGRGVDDLVYVCPKAGRGADPDCDQGNVIAWALGHDGTTEGNWIALCPLFFNPNQMGTLAQSQAAFSRGQYQDCFGLTLLHEATHHAEIVGRGSDTDDHSYDLAEMKLLPDNQKIDNAESLAVFALDAFANPDRLRPAASCPAPPRNNPRFLHEHPRMVRRQAQTAEGPSITQTIVEGGRTTTVTLPAAPEPTTPGATNAPAPAPPAPEPTAPGTTDAPPPPPEPTPTQPEQSAPPPPPADPPAPTTTDDNGGAPIPPVVPPPVAPPAPPVVPPVVPPGGGGNDPPEQPTNPTTSDPPCSTAPPFNPTGQRPTDVVKNPAGMAAILARMNADAGGGGGGGGSAQPTDTQASLTATVTQASLTVTEPDSVTVTVADTTETSIVAA